MIEFWLVGIYLSILESIAVIASHTITIDTNAGVENCKWCVALLCGSVIAAVKHLRFQRWVAEF